MHTYSYYLRSYGYADQKRMSELTFAVCCKVLCQPKDLEELHG